MPTFAPKFLHTIVQTAPREGAGRPRGQGRLHFYIVDK